MTNGPGIADHPVPAEKLSRTPDPHQQQHGEGRPEGVGRILEHLRPGDAVIEKGYGL